MIKKESACNGCEDCIECGLKLKQEVYAVCDKCKNDIDCFSENGYFSVDGKELCGDCFLQAMKGDWWVEL